MKRKKLRRFQNTFLRPLQKNWGVAGVNDNGSGVAVMMKIAEGLTTSGCRFNNSLYFVAFDQEEEGAFGSSFFVNDYLIPEMLQPRRGHFQGAFILDTVLNFNNSANSQDLPEDFVKVGQLGQGRKERQKRGKYRILKLGEKLDVLSDIKKGLSYTTIMQKYKISKTTVYDIKKSELKLTKFVDSTEKDVKKFSQVKNPLYENVDKAVNIWYESQRLSGVPIRGIELQTAASHFASKLNNPTFKASGGWLSRYRARHNLKNKKVVGEALSADEDAANRFKDDFHKLMTDEKYEQFQIYNADETGVYWKSLPDNSQALPSLESYITHEGRRGDFLAMISRNGVENRLATEFMRQWERTAADHHYKLFNMAVNLEPKAQTLEDIEQYINFLRSDHYRFWFPDVDTPQPLSAVLLTDTEFCVKLQILATETFEMLNKAFPNDAPKKTTVFEWHSRFKAGRISIEDAPQNPRTTLLELEQGTGISKTTIGKIVTEDLKLKKTPAKCIPRFLTNEQNLCDETWVYGYDPETKRQSAEWRGQGEPRPKKSRILKSRNKVLLVAFLDNKGIVHHEYLPAGQTVINEMYLSILRRLREAIRKKRPEKWTNGDWILHHDNARPHTAHLVTSFLAKNGTEILPQPPYSPDIAPNDFFLFPKLKAVLKGRHFDTREDIIEKSLLALKSIPKEAYKNCFDNWEKRLRWGENRLLNIGFGPFRGVMRECYHERCDNTSTITPDSLQFATKTADALTATLVELAEGTPTSTKISTAGSSSLVPSLLAILLPLAWFSKWLLPLV
ncbi:hypothetical protein LAZ67_18001789 [Cordylochernes scorpioides]|uniref:HTH CENPB-type domain-containing protein n=1 Tax=Cordylochernes scorpioides TaxID=51811 RepID=A0ABY6LIU9_9ARAC|nr:hypothetical protein LAZ67_18001789 [Cordylochernes scorpioides]